MLVDASVPQSSELSKCRICFETEKTLIYIYEVNGALKYLARTIVDILKYEVSLDDQFPPFICTDCSDKLCEFKAFKVKCDYLRDAYKLLLNSKVDSSDNTNTRVDGGSYEAEKIEAKAIVDRYIAELDCDESFKSLYKMDIEEHEVPICNTVSDGALRCRKTIDSKQRPADSDLSDPESNDSFHPTHQDDSNSICSDDSLNSVSSIKRRERLTVFREGVDPIASKNIPRICLLNGALGVGTKEEMGNQSNEKTICDPRTAADGSIVNNTVSIVSTVNKVSSGSIIDSKSESSGVQVDLSSSDTPQSSIKSPTITSKLDLSHSAKNMGSNHSVNLSLSVKNFSRILTSNDPTQLTSDSDSNENHSVSSVPLESCDENAGPNREVDVSHESEAITLKHLLAGHSYFDKVSMNSILQNNISSIPMSKSVSWQDILANKEVSSSSRSSFSQTNSVSPSLADVLETEIIPNNDVSESIQSREGVIDSALILQSSINLDSAVTSQSFSVQKNDTEASEWMTKQLKETGKYGGLYPGISTIDLKSFGITFETETEDLVPDNNGATILQVENKIARMDAEKDRDMQSSRSVTLEISGAKLPGEGSSSTAIPEVENSGGNLVHGSMKTRETAVLCDDQNNATEKSSILGAMEVERKEMFNTRDQESSREMVINNVPFRLQAIASSTDSSHSSSPSTPSNFSYESSYQTIQASERSIAKPSDFTHLASQGLSRVHHTSTNMSNGFTGLNSLAGFSNLAIPTASSSLIFLQRRPASTVPTTFSSYKPLPHHSINNKGPVMSPTVTTVGTGYTTSSDFPRYSNSSSNIGTASILGSSGECSTAFQGSIPQTKSKEITTPAHYQSGSVDSHMRMTLKNHLPERTSSVVNSKVVVNVELVQRKQLVMTHEVNHEQNTSNTEEVLNVSNISSGRVKRGCEDNGKQPPRENVTSRMETSNQNPIAPAKDMVICVDKTESCMNASKLDLSLGRNGGGTQESETIKINIPMASSPQRNEIRNLADAVPTMLNCYNYLSNLEDLSRSVLNSTTVDTSTSNTTPLGISMNPIHASSSACNERLDLHSSEKSLSALNQDLLLQDAYKDIATVDNFTSEPEVRKNRSEVLGEAELRSSETSRSDDEGEDDIQEDFDSERTLKKNPTKEFLCEFCGNVYLNKHSLKMHKKNVHRVKKFKCNMCPKVFAMKHHLIQHFSMHDKSRPFSCKECGDCFKLKTHLKQHEVVHSKKQKYQCAHCDLGFNTKWQHDNHQLSHEGKVVWSCEGCAEKLKTWAEYVDHILEHKKNQIYKCNICSKTYNIKDSLKKHIQSHIKSLECSVCGKCFGLRKILKIHMRIHTGERPYVCKVCGKSFAQSIALKSHMVTHSDARPFKCQFCNHRTKWKSVLKKHERRKHPQ